MHEDVAKEVSDVYGLVMTVVAVLLALVATGLCIKAGYLKKLLVKWGLKTPVAKIDWTASSWESCLLKMGARADVVFFGDSITRGGNFHQQFPNTTIVNLGSSGDTLHGMLRRVSTVQLLNPQKVFFLGGINGLTDHNGKVCIKTYEKVVDALQAALPEATIYLHSVLPVAKKRERGLCKNTTIAAFNQEIEKLAQRKGLVYIDLYHRYLLDGSLNPIYPKEDGLHLLPESYALWYEAITSYMNVDMKV